MQTMCTSTSIVVTKHINETTTVHIPIAGMPTVAHTVQRCWLGMVRTYVGYLLESTLPHSKMCLNSCSRLRSFAPPTFSSKNGASLVLTRGIHYNVL